MVYLIADNIKNQSSGADQSRLPHSELAVEKAGLTQYEEIVEPDVLEEEVVSSTSLFDITKYLETQDVGTIMERSYQVAEISWAIGDVVETSKGTFRFPKLLWDQSWIKNVMGAYKYFRCKGVEIAFRIQSTSMHQGALNISHVFNEDPAEPDSFRASYSRRRNNRPLLFSAMPGNSQILRIPWNNPVQWCRVADIAADTFNLGVVDIDVIVPLRSVAPTVLDCKVTVFANFIEPELAGPSLFVAQGKTKKKGDGNADKESTAKAEGGVLEFVNTISETVETVTSLASTLAPLAALIIDKPTDGSADIPTHYGFGSSQLTISGTSSETTLGADQLTMLTQQEGSMGPGVPNPSLLSLMQTPGYRRTYEFSNSVLQGAIDVEPAGYAYVLGSSSKFAPSFLSYFCNPFAYWRGSITYQLFFFCSTFTSARFRITWTPEATASVVVTGQQGNIMSKVVEVRGDTHTTVTIPYAKPELWSKVFKAGQAADNEATRNGWLQIDRISVSSIAADPIISCIMYDHAGPDFQVGRYVPQLFHTSEDPASYTRKYVSQGEETAPSASVWEYATVADPIYTGNGLEVSGYAQAEAYSDVGSLLKRMHETYCPNTPGVGSFLPPAMDSHLNGSRDPVNMILNCFRYYRGGVRMQFIRASGALGSVFQVWDEHDVSLIDNPGYMGLTVRIKYPWFSQFPFEKTTLNTTGRFRFIYADSLSMTPAQLLWSMADDVGVSGLFSPPLLEVTLNP